MKQSAFDLLGHGFLPADRENILFFVKILAWWSLTAMAFFIMGILLDRLFLLS
jgi:hypothetical protein